MNVGANRQLSGEYGGKYIADTNAHTGNWSEIYAVTNTVIASSTSNITGLNGVTIVANQSIRGVFTAVQLTSGSIVAYNRKHG